MGTPWDDRARIGFIPALVETTQKVLTAPSSFFASMPVAGGIGGPLQDIADGAFFAYATPRVPDPALEEMEQQLRAAGITVRRAGDCLAPRGVLEATAEGYAVGVAI